MKKLLLIFSLIAFAITVNAQWLTNNYKLYTVKNFVGIGVSTPTVPFDVKGASKFVGNMSVTGVTTHVGNLNVTGNITASGSITPNASPGAGSFTTIDATGNCTFTGNVGIGTGNNKFVITGASGNTSIAGTVGITGATTVTGGLVGTSITRGTGTFTTTATRVAIAITGATSSDFYIITPIAPASSGAGSRPVAGDLMSCYAVTDSLIVMRAAGTTSGGTFNYFRIK